MNTHVVIMAGGIGSRFWPLSTPDHPKQFIDVLGCGRSLIQMTFDRLAEVCQPENFWVVTNAAYVEIVKEQLPLISESHILAEPAARNTAPCIAWACLRISAENPDANILVTPSDAVVMNQAEFQRVVKNALVFTKDNEAIVPLVYVLLVQKQDMVILRLLSVLVLKFVMLKRLKRNLTWQ